MQSCDLAVSAVINGKEQPNHLYVHGSVLTYGANDEVSVSEAVPQGINPRILVLDVTIKQNGGPLKGTCSPLAFRKAVEGKQYDQVTVRYGAEQSDTVDVRYFG